MIDLIGLRGVVFAEEGCLIARCLEAGEFFAASVMVSAATGQKITLAPVEGFYRWLDRRLFGQRLSSQARQPSSLNTPTFDLQGVPSGLVLNLSGAALPNGFARAAASLRLDVEGFSPGNLVEAVRGKLGCKGGRVRLDWWLERGDDSHLLVSAHCCLDHRSLQRSVEQVALKAPMSLKAAMARLALSPEDGCDALPMEAIQEPLSAWQMLGRLLWNALRWPLLRDQWRMQLFRGSAVDQVIEPTLVLAPPAGAFWADPFLAQGAHGQMHLLYEDLDFKFGRGRIAAITIQADGSRSKPKIVLEEPWHLSYPFLLDWQGRTYMIPESSANRTVDLYLCEQMPDRWVKQATLIEGERLADATLIEWQGRWWMFAAHAQEGASLYDELSLYWATEPLGPWHAHALNPVKIDARGARPAGAMFVQDGRLIRPTQDCSDTYGGGVIFQEVLQLDEMGFREREIANLSLPGIVNSVPVHTYNEANGLICVDSLHKKLRWPG